MFLSILFQQGGRHYQSKANNLDPEGHMCSPPSTAGQT
jgi:hypothetical protein